MLESSRMDCESGSLPGGVVGGSGWCGRGRCARGTGGGSGCNYESNSGLSGDWSLWARLDQVIPEPPGLWARLQVV